MYFRIVLFFLLMTSLIFTVSSCGNNSKTPEIKESEAPKDTMAIVDTTQVTPENKITPDSSDSSTNSGKDKAPDGPPPNYSSLPGPVGFVNEDNLIMRDKPGVKSNKIATLKNKETVYILETSMVGDDGKDTQYPTWYKIERKSKERGWVKASAVSSGH